MQLGVTVNGNHLQSTSKLVERAMFVGLDANLFNFENFAVAVLTKLPG